MPSRTTRGLAQVAAHSPGLKRLPMLRLLAAAEVAALTRDHVRRLTPAERRRMIELVRRGRGRGRNLSPAERDELASLVLKFDARQLAGETVHAFSPVPLPRRLVYGRRSR